MSSVSRLPAVAACIALVTFAGCSDDGGDTADSSVSTTVAVTERSASTTVAPAAGAPTTAVSATSVATAPPVTTTPDAVIDIDDQPGEGLFEGAADDATLACAAADGVWTASGTVTNSTEVAVGYRIFISFLDEAGETLALVQVDDDLDGVEPGEERDWSVSFESSSSALDCVPRVERRPA